jgi:hypothetical protein
VKQLRIYKFNITIKEVFRTIQSRDRDVVLVGA